MSAKGAFAKIVKVSCPGVALYVSSIVRKLRCVRIEGYEDRSVRELCGMGAAVIE